MKTLRQVHLYLGCFFAPLIVYFCLSGTWQVFRFNNLPKDATPSWAQTVLHELSKPHTNSTLPGLNPKMAHSLFFNWMAAAMGLGMIVTALLGIVLALRFTKSPKLVLGCLFLGVALPIWLLLLR